MKVEAPEGTEHYTYAADGLRRRKVTAAGTTQFVWDGQNLLAELDHNGFGHTFTRSFSTSCPPVVPSGIFEPTERNTEISVMGDIASYEFAR